MNENEKQKSLVDATDCLEAIGVFKSWKNVFFMITLICLVLLQISFWAADLEAAKETSQPSQPVATAVQQAVQNVSVQTENTVTDIQQAAAQVAADVNIPAVEKPARKSLDLSQIIKPGHINWAIRLADFVIIASSMLYCLTLLFCLKISLIGRLGGINHISRAFFISLILLVLLMPWQQLFGWFLTGAVFAPSELNEAIKNFPDMTPFEQISYYLRFAGYWVIIFLLLIFAQARASRWSRATLKRLEVI